MMQIFLCNWFQWNRALDGLIAVKGAESGVPRVLFTAMELMMNHSSGDNELAQASRCHSLIFVFCFSKR